MRSQVSNTTIITPVSNSPQPPVRRRRAQSVQAVQGISRIHDSEPRRRVSLFESNVSASFSSFPYVSYTSSDDFNLYLCSVPKKLFSISKKKTLRFSYFFLSVLAVLHILFFFVGEPVLDIIFTNPITRVHIHKTINPSFAIQLPKKSC